MNIEMEATKLFRVAGKLISETYGKSSPSDYKLELRYVSSVPGNAPGSPDPMDLLFSLTARKIAVTSLAQFSLEGVAAGNYSLLISRQGSAIEAVPISIEDRNPDFLEMQPPQDYTSRSAKVIFH